MLGQYELLLPISSEELQHEKISYLQNYAWKSIKIEKLPIHRSSEELIKK
jgi:hypothetical protein